MNKNKKMTTRKVFGSGFARYHILCRILREFEVFIDRH